MLSSQYWEEVPECKVNCLELQYVDVSLVSKFTPRNLKAPTLSKFLPYNLKHTSSPTFLLEEIFSINEDLPVTIQSKLSHPGYTGMNADKSELVYPTANLTFNLHLSDTEREAKEKLPLPFDFREEKKSALLHLGLSSGRILYEPDANDDYDPEDPDDDLDF
ncbi:elongator complex protein 5-like [Oncorhynchus nerka]|uniref:elongator complex protein 5-like n=1 Tax=Oncorhynchus nerka TaxID=8023 RepID=UPI0031B86CC7